MNHWIEDWEALENNAGLTQLHHLQRFDLWLRHGAFVAESVSPPGRRPSPTGQRHGGGQRGHHRRGAGLALARLHGAGRPDGARAPVRRDLRGHGGRLCAPLGQGPRVVSLRGRATLERKGAGDGGLRGDQCVRKVLHLEILLANLVGFLAFQLYVQIGWATNAELWFDHQSMIIP